MDKIILRKKIGVFFFLISICLFVYDIMTLIHGIIVGNPIRKYSLIGILIVDPTVYFIGSYLFLKETWDPQFLALKRIIKENKKYRRIMRILKKHKRI